MCLVLRVLEGPDRVDQRVGEAGDPLADGVDPAGRGRRAELAEIAGHGRQDHRRGDVRSAVRLDVLDLDIALPADLDARGELALAQDAE